MVTKSATKAKEKWECINWCIFDFWFLPLSCVTFFVSFEHLSS
ncbi:hypothetical protein HanIR_Chr12g0606051 [Helianthus annuus]|nr:hypothetical protein HanIR_Chr12g0606051 [Helianthus annuus]